MKNFVIASLGSLAVAGAASADFSGIVFNEYQSADGVYCIADIYAAFTTDADVLLNVFDVQASLEGGFDQLNHADLAGVSWSPALASGNGANDTFVTIGGGVGFSNSTQADPNWGAAGFQQPGIPALAGWFNSNPPNLQGQAQGGLDLSNLTGSKTYEGAGTFIMRLVIDKSLLTDAGIKLTFNGSLTYNQGLGTAPIQPDFMFNNQLWAIPAPGALALLGLAGLAGGRRRRA